MCACTAVEQLRWHRRAQTNSSACILQPIDHDVVKHTRPAAQQRDKGAAAKTLGGTLSYMCARAHSLDLQSGQRQQNGVRGEVHSGSCVATFELVSSTAGGNINPTTSQAEPGQRRGCGQGLRCSLLALKWLHCLCVRTQLHAAVA